MRHTVKFFHLFLGLFLLVTPLKAQLDPRLQGAKADFLDLYQANTTSVKPEVLTVLDFSGSMHAMMWHPKYWTNKAQNNHLPSGWTGSDNVFFIPYVYSYDPGTYEPTVRFVLTDYSSSTYSAGNQLGLNTASGKLVKANGNLVTSSDVSLSGTTTSKLAAWIRAATHVRITATHPTSGITRTLDIPLAYKIHDSSSQVDVSYASYSTSWAPDPQNSDRATYFDALGDDDSYVFDGDDLADSYSFSVIGKGRIGLPWYNRDYMYWLFFGTKEVNATSTGEDETGTYVVPDASGTGKAFRNGIPALSRYQGTKRALISTWLVNQTKVYWAYRFLDGNEESKTTVDPFNSGGGLGSDDHNLTLLKKATGGVADPSVRKIQDKLPASSTPLTYALANAYAQLNVDKNSVFDAPHTDDKYNSPQCQTMYVILFTDGIPNDDVPSGGTGGNAIGTDNPYGTVITDSAAKGNSLVNADLGSLNPGGKFFNIQTLAGVAAHGADPSLKPSVIPVPATYPTNSAQALRNFAPFFIQKRGNGTAFSVTFKPPRPIQTMTVGVSLAGAYNDSTSPKFRLLAAATYGNPLVSEWDLSQASPYSADNPNSYFFDARNPQALVDNLIAAISATQQPIVRTTGTLATPLVGLTLGDQIYLGSFTPSKTPSPVWSGDLRMFATRVSQTELEILDKSGTRHVNQLDKGFEDPDAPQWSAKTDALSTSARKWSDRTIYTRLPASAFSKTPGLVKFMDTGAEYDAIKGYVATALASDDAKKSVINFVRGRDTKDAAKNRIDIMGDVINSNPVALEFPLSMAPGSLTAKAGGTNNLRYRVIFVGTNQGMFHAFGEVSWDTYLPDGKKFTQGAVEELWSFIPTDFLEHIDDLVNAKKTHRYMVDGSVNVYHKDAPTAVSSRGNGVVDGKEEARVFFGLRKGGRSWYGLKFTDNNPSKPEIAWALRGDEAEVAGYSADVKNAVKFMGFSYGFPSLGRVYVGDDTAPVLKDVVFLGGGYSVPEVEAFFKVGGTNPNGYLGRSVFVLDVKDGTILKAWDFLALKVTMGPVAAGVAPFEFFLNSGRVQRAYFADFGFDDVGGGIWALGSGKTTDSAESKTYAGFRRDSSNLDDWTTTGAPTGSPFVRKVFQSESNQRISTRISPFLLPTLPAVVQSGDAKGVAPLAVGIPFVTGDRNDPADLYTPAVAFNQLTMVFDRQDSKNLGFDLTGILGNAKLTDLSAVATSDNSLLSQTNAGFYLNATYGYYLKFPAPVKKSTTPPAGQSLYFYPKGIQSPLVLDNVLYFSYFSPQGYDPCGGGNGTSTSFRECRALYPLYGRTGTADAATFSSGDECSGQTFTWVSVATEFASRGISAALQGGNIPGTPSGSGDTTGSGGVDIAIKKSVGNQGERYPRPRVWRSVVTRED